ncbi:MAG: Ig-like domain repeat protein [Aquabacterium sp.]
MTYRLRPLALMLAAACQFASINVSAAELLVNPGFETGFTDVTACTGSSAPITKGQLGNNWESNNCWMDAPGAKVNFAPGAARTGSYSQMVTTTGANGSAMIASFVMLASGQRYTTTVWMKADQPVDVVLQLRAWLAPATAYGTTVAKVGTSWAPFTFESVPPATGTQTPGGLFILPKGPATLLIDDASVTGVADPSVGVQSGLQTRAGVTIPASYFGTHIHRSPTWPAVGKAIGSERLWDAGGLPIKSGNTYQDNQIGANWVSVYENPASPNWSAFDDHVNRALANGNDVVMVLGGAIPTWASSDQQGTGNCNFYGNGTAAPPKADNDDQIWKSWVTAVATRGLGKVHYWEIWNEPYQCPAFVQNPKRLAELTAKARAILKSIDPTNVVLSPSFDLNDNAFLDSYLQAAKAAYPNGEAYGDNWAFHAYPNMIGAWLDDRVAKTGAAVDILRMRTEPESTFDTEHLVLNAKTVLKRYGVDTRPLWDTESGYIWAYAANGGPNDVAAVPFIARHYLLGWAAGLDRSYYYAWDQRASTDPDTGVITGWPVAGSRETATDNFNFVTTAAGLAYAQVSKWLTGANLYSINKNVDGAGTWVMTLKRGTAASQVVWNPAWTSTGSTISYTPATALSRRSDLSGATTTVAGASTITASPVLFSALATTVSATSSVNAVWQGWNLNVTLTANLSGGSTPSGYVQFQLDGKNLGSPVALSSGQAVLKTTDIDDAAVGIHAITANYLGDSYNPASTSAGVNVKVCTALGACP